MNRCCLHVPFVFNDLSLLCDSGNAEPPYSQLSVCVLGKKKSTYIQCSAWDSYVVGTCSSVSYTRKSLYGNYYVRNHINFHQINTINSLWLVHISFRCVWKFNFRNFVIFPCSNFRIYPGKSLFEQFCISINVNV